nr:MAG TPA: hypothetical protein [Caudoviricetes sp.]
MRLPLSYRHTRFRRHTRGLPRTTRLRRHRSI